MDCLLNTQVNLHQPSLLNTPPPRVYAYTSSAVQKAILRLFIKGEVLLPNIFIGSITRQSVMDALDCGTTGEQIISYLRQHAHPRVASRVPVVPGVGGASRGGY